MITQANYLDIGNFFINEIIGDVWLALAIGILLIVYFGVTNTMDFKAILGLTMIFSFGIASYYTGEAVWIMIALVVSFIMYGIYARFFK